MTTPDRPAPPAPTAAPDSKPMVAAAWMMGAVASFTSMAVAGRTVSIELDSFEILAWRSLFGIAIIAAIASLRGRWAGMAMRHPGLHLGRNIVHFAAQNLWFFAIVTVPLAQVFALEFTAPLWALLLSPLFLGERLTRARVLSAAIGFVGILLVARPGAAPITPGLVAAAGAALGFAATYIFTKRMTAVTSILAILWWMTVLQTIFGFACAGLDGRIAWPSAATLPWVLLIGATGLTAHFCIGKALEVAPATVVMPFDFLRLPAAALIGLLLYGEEIGALVIAGAALILCGNYLNLRAEARARRSRAAAA
ncbi:DMT family transporter [Paracoccus spongiarum]|uniref:DMT family transporter n=1 Tax=Paracoccus spongiarum TaxID=3064387 RepID=A0ABT9J7C9_9RHOB|nr:DMT family transporter [Paracoccus sp. 2205BS29-5]MDP5305714.1 DMT family transporter [Paracoccus sp. 2205BS29-5]